MKKLFALLLAAVLIFSITGCDGVVGDIAGNVTEVALKELESQIRKTVAEYKVDLVEIKSTVGQLSDDSDSDTQFFCGVLVRSSSPAVPQSICDKLDGVFDRSGMCAQTESAIKSEYLTNKEISFKHTDFSTGDYYLLWVYSPDLTSKLSDLKEKLEDLELPDSVTKHLEGLDLPTGLLPTESNSVG